MTLEGAMFGLGVRGAVGDLAGGRGGAIFGRRCWRGLLAAVGGAGDRRSSGSRWGGFIKQFFGETFHLDLLEGLADP